MEENSPIEKSDIVIRIRPEIEGREWTGNVELFAISSSDNTLSDESTSDLEYFVELVLASIPAMKSDPYIYNVLNTYASKVLKKHSSNSNIVKLKLNSETEGSA